MLLTMKAKAVSFAEAFDDQCTALICSANLFSLNLFVQEMHSIRFSLSSTDCTVISSV